MSNIQRANLEGNEGKMIGGNFFCQYRAIEESIVIMNFCELDNDQKKFILIDYEQIC